MADMPRNPLIMPTPAVRADVTAFMLVLSLASAAAVPQQRIATITATPVLKYQPQVDVYPNLQTTTLRVPAPPALPAGKPLDTSQLQRKYEVYLDTPQRSIALGINPPPVALRLDTRAPEPRYQVLEPNLPINILIRGIPLPPLTVKFDPLPIPRAVTERVVGNWQSLSKPEIAKLRRIEKKLRILRGELVEQVQEALVAPAHAAERIAPLKGRIDVLVRSLQESRAARTIANDDEEVQMVIALDLQWSSEQLAQLTKMLDEPTTLPPLKPTQLQIQVQADKAEQRAAQEAKDLEYKEYIRSAIADITALLKRPV